MPVTDKFGNTPLHDAAIGGHLECVRFLIGSGQCDPTLRDQENMTCSDIAEAHGHYKFVEEIRRLERLVSIIFTHRLCYCRSNNFIKANYQRRAR